jgi:hypothetical protein
LARYPCRLEFFDRLFSLIKKKGNDQRLHLIKIGGLFERLIADYEKRLPASSSLARWPRTLGVRAGRARWAIPILLASLAARHSSQNASNR